MKTRKIGTRNLIITHNLPGWDLNQHIIFGEQYTYVIDTGLGSENAESIQAHLEGNDKPIVVINTHHHWDHVWGNHFFAGKAIIAHKLCKQRIDDKWVEMLTNNGHYTRGKVRRFLPTHTFENSLYFPKDQIRLFHTPGHTADSISVYDEVDKVLNAGDNIGDTPDEPVPSLEMDKDTYRDTLARYMGMEPAFCVSGHNRLQDAGIFEKILSQL